MIGRFILVGLLAWLAPAVAAAAPPQESAESLEDLAAALEDDGERAELVARLRALAAAQRGEVAPAEAPREAGALGAMSRALGGFAERVNDAVSELAAFLAALPDEIEAAWLRLQEPEERRRVATHAWQMAAILAAAALAGLLSSLALRRVRATLDARTRTGPFLFAAKVWRGTTQVAVELVPPLLALVVASGAITALGPTATARIVALAIVAAFVATRIARAAIELLFAPERPSVRLVAVEDARARPLARSLRRLATVAIAGHFTLAALAELGAERDFVSPLRNAYALLLLVLGIVLVLRERPHVRARLERFAERASAGGAPWRSGVASLASLWWVAAIAWMIGLHSVWTFGGGDKLRLVLTATVKTLGVIVAATLVSIALPWLESRLRPSERYPELRARLPRYLALVRRGLRIAIAVAAVVLCLEAWGLSALGVFERAAVQRALFAVATSALILLAALAVVDVATVFTQRYLQALEAQGRASAKVRTLVPLARSTIKVVVLGVAALMILDELGVRIAPILAGVGVIGLAVGFGAQTLVKDIITGVFILIEDTMSVGDVVKVDERGGQVEAINLRTFRMRDLSGNVHTLPYSTVGAVTNMTKGYSRWLVEAAVAYREDVDQVIGVLRDVGGELAKDPAFERAILEPIEILGVDRFEDSSVIVRARFKTLPLEQWRVGREFNRRMKRRFDELGIEIPFPHRTLYFGEQKDGSAPPLHVTRGPAPARA